MATLTDTDRLIYLMYHGPDGIVGVEKDMYEYASEVAEEWGLEEPNEAAYLEGFRRMLDCAITDADEIL